MRKTNCWEYFHCERQLGGLKENELGTCPVSLAVDCNTTNHGVNAGRYCWKIPDSLCEFAKHHSFSQSKDICDECEFKKLVIAEENSELIE